MNTTVAFELDMRMNFVKTGYIDFIYAKDTVQETSAFRSGIFDVYIDDVLIYHDEELNDDPDDWKFKSLDISEGEHEITFVYKKYNSKKNKDLQLELKVRLLVDVKIVARL